MIFYSDNQTPPITPERFRTAAQQEERNQRFMGSPEQRRIPDQQPPPPPPPPAAAPISTISYNNHPPDLVQQLENLPDFPKPGRRGAPAPAPAPLTIEQLTAQHAALPALQPVRHGRPRKNIPAPAPAPAPAPLLFAQLAAQYAALQPVCLICYIYLN